MTLITYDYTKQKHITTKNRLFNTISTKSSSSTKNYTIYSTTKLQNTIEKQRK